MLLCTQEIFHPSMLKRLVVQADQSSVCPTVMAQRQAKPQTPQLDPKCESSHSSCYST